MQAFKKLAGDKCPHQRFRTGCAVYANRPTECRFWSCRWLVGNDTDDMKRPDHAGYCIDMMPDIIRMEDGVVIDVVQVWCDPKRPDAWRDPKMLAYIERRAREGIATTIRYNSEDSLAVFAPPFDAKDGKWHEIVTKLNPELLKVRKERHGY